MHRAFFTSEYQREDRTRGVAELHLRGKETKIFLKVCTKSITLRRLNDPEGRTTGGRYGRGGSCGEDKASGAVDQIIDQNPRSGDVSAGDTESLTERSHLDVDLITKTQLACKPLSSCTANAHRMCLIKEEDRAIAFLQRDDFTERSQIAIHAED